MNDQEMIKSAAKAVGFLHDQAQTGKDGTLKGRYRLEEKTAPLRAWNPRTNLDDAINMAAQVGLRLEYKEGQVWAHYGANMHLSEPLSLGAKEATMLVLTRVAAEVGTLFL